MINTSRYTMKNFAVILILVFIMSLLTGCNNQSSNLFIGYDAEDNPFNRYNGITLSQLPGEITQEETTIDDLGSVAEGESNTDSEVSTDTPSITGKPLTGNTASFDDGGEGLVMTMPTSSQDYIGDDISSGSYSNLSSGGLAKYMTAYLVCKYTESFDDMITYTEDAQTGLENAKKIGYILGDTFTVEDAVYGMFVGSGNDAANALAIYTQGSITDFVTAMNNEAAALGATNTTFINPTGLDSTEGVNQTTTVYDMFLIMKAALNYDLILDATQLSYYSGIYHNSEGSEISYEWINDNLYVNDQYEMKDQFTILSGQTTNTPESGYCSTVYYTDTAKNRYIAIVLHSSGYDRVYSSIAQLMKTTL